MTGLEGQRLGSYRLVHLLGQGGFADVFLGEHVHLHTQAAIKVLQTRLVNENLQGFLEEARTIAQLEHPHIIRILDFGVENGVPFLVMAYAPGGTLRQRHPQKSVVPKELAASYVRQVAEALQFAHQQKLIHRDVKPENMLLGRNDEVLLSDFGIAVTAQSTSHQHTVEVKGSAAYMAPEQLQGKPTPASDQYSLGITSYEWLSGERPFQGTFMEVFSQHLTTPPLPLHEKVPGISSALSEVVQRALTKDQRQRFPTILEFATAFERACAPSVTSASTLVRPQPSQPLPPVQESTPFPQTPPTAFQPSGPVGIGPTVAAPSMSGPLVQPSNPTPALFRDMPPLEVPPPGSPPPATSGSFSVPAVPGAPPPEGARPENPPGALPLRPRLPRPGRKLGLAGVVASLLVLAVVLTLLVSGFFSKPGGQLLLGPGGLGSGPTSTPQNTPTPTSTFTPTSTPTPTTLPPGTVFYEANWSTDFSTLWSGPQQWKIVNNGTTTHLVSDGESNNSTAKQFILWYNQPLPAMNTNYAIIAKIRLDRSSSPDGFYEFGLIARGDGNHSGYEAGEGYQNTTGGLFNFCPGPFAEALIALVQNDPAPGDCSGAAQLLGPLGSVNGDPLDNAVHTYRLEVKGNELALYLDGKTKPLIETTDNTFTAAGQVGLRDVYGEITVLSFQVVIL